MISVFKIIAIVQDKECINTFFGIPPWYNYLTVRKANQCTPQIEHINQVWLIAVALLEMATRVAILVAIAFVIYGGIKYSASRGNPDKVENAKSTVIDALTGLVIAIVATAIIGFVGRQFSQG